MVTKFWKFLAPYLRKYIFGFTAFYVLLAFMAVSKVINVTESVFPIPYFTVPAIMTVIIWTTLFISSFLVVTVMIFWMGIVASLGGSLSGIGLFASFILGGWFVGMAGISIVTWVFPHGLFTISQADEVFIQFYAGIGALMIVLYWNPFAEITRQAIKDLKLEIFE